MHSLSRPWWLALSLLAICLLGLAYIKLPLEQYILSKAMPHQPIIIIGSSLSGHAIPPEGKNILGDGRAYARLYISGLREQEALEYFARAISMPHVDVIMIEIYPFIMDFHGEHQEAQNHMFLHRVGAMLITDCLSVKQILKDIAEYAGLIKGRKAAMQSEPPLDVKLKIERRILRFSYPLFPRPPREAARLHNLIKIARAKDIEVIFIATPRSSTADSWNGPVAREGLLHQMKDFSKYYGVSVIDINQIWPDSYFIDHAHLNRAGRNRFISMLTTSARMRHVS